MNEALTSAHQSSKFPDHIDFRYFGICKTLLVPFGKQPEQERS